MIPMNIWYAGMLFVAIFATFGKNNSEELAHRLARTMPIIVAIGINLGIVPLLFTQVGYYQFYYPAGVLIGWPWISVIILLAIAYYGVYIYSLNVRKNKKTKFAIASAWISSILFIAIGFLFANNFSLMVNVDNWINIFNRTNVSGCADRDRTEHFGSDALSSMAYDVWNCHDDYGSLHRIRRFPS